MNNYIPSKTILQKYAAILINFALNSGKGVKPKEVVQVVFDDVAKPLGFELQTAILEAGGQPLLRMLPSGGFDKNFFELANDDQLKFFPREYFREQSKLIDHQIVILSDVDPYELKNIDPQKIMTARNSKKEYQDWLRDKENAGKFTWTLALWGTESKSKIVNLSLKAYWQQIIKGCYLEEANPVKNGRKFSTNKNQLRRNLMI